MCASWYAAARSTRVCHSSLLTRSRTDVWIFGTALIGAPGERSMLAHGRNRRELAVARRLDRLERLQQELGAVRPQALRVGQEPTPEAGLLVAVVQAQHVARDVAHRFHALRVLVHRKHDLLAGLARVGEQPGMVVRGAPEHRAVDVREMGRDLGPARDAAVDYELERRELGLEAVHGLVLERRDLAGRLSAKAPSARRCARGR